MTTTEPGRMYRNLHHREGAGWLAGLSTGQAVVVGAACVPVVVAVGRGGGRRVRLATGRGRCVGVGDGPDPRPARTVLAG